jgi:hypothetical protein
MKVASPINLFAGSRAQTAAKVNVASKANSHGHSIAVRARWVIY